MTEKEDLGLEHRNLLYELLRDTGSGLSEYSFANLYLFRHEHAYQLSRKGEEVWIHGRDRRGESYIMPTRDVRTFEPSELEEIIHREGPLFPVPEEWALALDESIFHLEYHDDDSDYIHYISKLTGYPGKKMQKKRNLMKQFLKLYTYQALPLTGDRLPDARQILEAWQSEINLEASETDFNAASEALELYDPLVLCGGIYYIDEKPAGYIIGEEAAPDMFVLHFAKGLREIKGIYQFMYSNFADIMPDHYVSFNFEQDLGNPALRQAKMSYRPEMLLKKYRVSIKD